MQREEKQLVYIVIMKVNLHPIPTLHCIKQEAALEALLQRINDLKTSIRTLLFRLENEYASLSWPSVLDSYAVISGQVILFSSY
jgi:hypothetical protein